MTIQAPDHFPALLTHTLDVYRDRALHDPFAFAAQAIQTRMRIALNRGDDLRHVLVELHRETGRTTFACMQAVACARFGHAAIIVCRQKNKSHVSRLVCTTLYDLGVGTAASHVSYLYDQELNRSSVRSPIIVLDERQPVVVPSLL